MTNPQKQNFHVSNVAHSLRREIDRLIDMSRARRSFDELLKDVDKSVAASINRSANSLNKRLGQ